MKLGMAAGKLGVIVEKLGTVSVKPGVLSGKLGTASVKPGLFLGKLAVILGKLRGHGNLDGLKENSDTPRENS